MATEPALRAVLFDIDGTLVDSNYLHIDAWDRAFSDAGAPVDVWKIHRSIGMDSKKLLEALVGDVDQDVQDKAKELHESYYKETAGRLRSFGGAQDVARELADRGFKVVFATSAPEDELEILRGVLEVDDAVAEMTSSGDVGTAKPDPDIIESALAKAEVDASEAVMVGDSRWDMEAAARAGVIGIGVLSGGISEAELKDAGAAEVYADVAALLANLDQSLVGRRAPGQ